MFSTAYANSIRPQFEASLSMLARAVELADDATWLAPAGERAFWEVAMHVAYYAHLYLSPDFDRFEGPPDFAGPNSAGMGRAMEPPFDPVDPGPPVDRLKTLDYIRAAHGKLIDSLRAETDASLAGPSGFFWLTFPRAELYLYNLRHVQHHTAQLHVALRRAGKQPEWHAAGWT